MPGPVTIIATRRNEDFLYSATEILVMYISVTYPSQS